MGPALPRGERDPGGSNNLVGPDEALLVSWGEALRAARVEPRQPFVKPDASEKPMELVGLLSNRPGDCGNRCETLLERTHVKPGAPDNNRQTADAYRRCDLDECLGTPVGDRAALGGVEITIEPMRGPRLGAGIGTRRQDAQIAVDLPAVGIDDGATKGFCQA